MANHPKLKRDPNKPGGRPKGSRDSQSNPLAKAIAAELAAYKDEATAGFNYAEMIVKRLVKIASTDNVPEALSIQAAKEIREISYSQFGKPTQAIDHGFDLGAMIRKLGGGNDDED